MKSISDKGLAIFKTATHFFVQTDEYESTFKHFFAFSKINTELFRLSCDRNFEDPNLGGRRGREGGSKISTRAHVTHPQAPHTRTPHTPTRKHTSHTHAHTPHTRAHTSHTHTHISLDSCGRPPTSSSHLSRWRTLSSASPTSSSSSRSSSTGQLLEADQGPRASGGIQGARSCRGKSRPRGSRAYSGTRAAGQIQGSQNSREVPEGEDSRANPGLRFVWQIQGPWVTEQPRDPEQL